MQGILLRTLALRLKDPSAFLDTTRSTPILNVVAAVIFLAFAFLPQFASADEIDFEGLVDSTVLTSQYSGLTFSNTVILSAGIGLDEFEFPPHSGTNVVSDDGGPLSILFATPISSFSGYFTYFEPLTVTAFDSAHNQIGQSLSLFASNLGLSGDPSSFPNELLQVSSGNGISEIVIYGNPNGGSFTMDDLAYQSAATNVPESSSLILILAGLAFAAVHGKFKSLT